MLPIVKLPTESLRERSVEIDQQTLALPETQKLIDDMIPTMYGDDGIGLAAPQVGHNIRLFVIGKEALKNYKIQQWGCFNEKEDLAIINPVWYKLTRKTAWDIEGCLSVPKTFGKVRRYKDIHLEALDRYGKTISLDAHGYLARVIQHETDHLNGVLFIDKAKGVYTVD